MKKILITGAHSYIGTSFENYIQKWPDEFFVDTIDMHGDDWRKKDFSAYDVVFHVAGIAHADIGKATKEQRQLYYKVNTELAIETAKKAKREGVCQFIFMSSIIIYGEGAGFGKRKIITRKTKPIPANFYGDSKWRADQAIRKLENKFFHVLVLRPPMIYGKGSKGNYPVLSRLAKTLPVFPYVNNQRSMLYVDNLCEFLRQAIHHNCRGIYFPQNAEYIRTSDMVQEIASTAGHKIIITKLITPLVLLGSMFPGKMGEMIHKAFGSIVYDKKISKYAEISYQLVDLKESIEKSEGF